MIQSLTAKVLFMGTGTSGFVQYIKGLLEHPATLWM